MKIQNIYSRFDLYTTRYCDGQRRKECFSDLGSALASFEKSEARVFHLEERSDRKSLLSLCRLEMFDASGLRDVLEVGIYEDTGWSVEQRTSLPLEKDYDSVRLSEVKADDGRVIRLIKTPIPRKWEVCRSPDGQISFPLSARALAVQGDGKKGKSDNPWWWAPPAPPTAGFQLVENQTEARKLSDKERQ